MADVFISYHRDDVARAEPIAIALREWGWSVWWDRNMRAGPSFRRVIAEELERAKCVVVLWSSRSIDSDWVCEEADEARQRGILVPVLLDPVRPPLGFRQNQTANLVGWNGVGQHAELDVLRDGITHHVAPQRTADEARDTTTAALPTPDPRTPDQRGAKKAIFLSYRREDAQDAAGRLCDRLVDAFGSDRVKMDIESVPLGVDYVQHVSKAIATCGAVIVVIGRDWLKVTDRTGQPRLEKDTDYVRTEIAAALRAQVPVIPVLVQNARMPSDDELPENIRPLARRNAISLRSTDWSIGVSVLIKTLEQIMER